jgi:hypothetical protein
VAGVLGMKEDLKKVEPIKPDVIKQWEKLATEAGKLEEKITDRMNYILHSLFEMYGAKLDTWYFDGAGEGEMGELSRYLRDDEIYGIVTELYTRDRFRDKQVDIIFIDKNDHECSYEGAIPTRWLFEDFETEVLEGKKKYEEKEAARKLQAKENLKKQKEEDKKLAEVAKAKLSKKELAALRRTL